MSHQQVCRSMPPPPVSTVEFSKPLHPYWLQQLVTKMPQRLKNDPGSGVARRFGKQLQQYARRKIHFSAAVKVYEFSGARCMDQVPVNFDTKPKPRANRKRNNNNKRD